MSDRTKSEQHLKLARSNHSLARALSEFPTHCDWVATACFYAAIHYLQYDLNPAQTIDHHQQREKKKKKKYDKNSKVWLNYRKLKERSLNARYFPNIASTMKGDKQQAISSRNLLNELIEKLKTAPGK